MGTTVSLYDWFDEKCRSEIESVARIAACQQVVYALGTLAGLGTDQASLAAFLDQTLEGTYQLLRTAEFQSARTLIDRLSDSLQGVSPERTEDLVPRRDLSLLRICPRCEPPSRVEEKSLGILQGACSRCGSTEAPRDLRVYRLGDVLARLAELEQRVEAD